MPKKMSVTLKVRSYELDSFGHVNNAVYLQYMEYARCEYMNQVGLGFQSFHDWGVTPFVTKVEIEYKSPSLVDEELEFIAEVTEWRRVGFSIVYEVQNLTTGRLAATAKASFAFSDKNGKLCPVPQEFREKMGG